MAKTNQTTTTTDSEDLTDIPLTDPKAPGARVLAPGVIIINSVAAPAIDGVEDFICFKYKIEPENYSAKMKMILGRLTTYIKNVHPATPTSVDNIVKEQGQYLQTLLGILNSDSNEALLLWDAVLYLAHFNSDSVFNARNANRFYNRLPDAKQRQFLTLMTLVIETANGRTREQALRTYRIESILPVLDNDKQRTNLAAFYAGSISAN